MSETKIVQSQSRSSKSEEFNWQFHFRNFYDFNMHVRVHHAGCAITPWYDGRPCCWKNKDLPYSPTGLSSGEGVYQPSDWVVKFGDWWPVIMDGLKLIVDIGIMIEDPTIDNLTSALMDVFDVGEDAITACTDSLSEDEINELLAQADQSVEHAADSVGMEMSEVKKLASDMGLRDGEWGFIAGSTYTKYIHNNDGPIVYKHGWSIFREHDQSGDDYRRIARGAFINQGHLIYPLEENSEHKLWSDDW